MHTRLQFFLTVFTISFKEWWAKDPFKESAVIAYYAIFSLPGLLVILITVAGYFFGQEAVNGQIASQVTSTLGADTAQQIQDIIANGAESKNSLLATTIGIITMLVGATGVFAQFQKSINAIWNVKTDDSKSGILSLLQARLFSVGIIVAIAFVLITSLVISTMLAALSNWITNSFSESLLVIFHVFHFIFSLSILAVLFAFMFKFFPDAKIKWRHVWIGSVVTAIFFETGKAALGIYFGKADPGSSYGAAGSTILILLWVSYSSMIVLYGAEFTHTYAELKDGQVQPTVIAKRIPDIVR